LDSEGLEAQPIGYRAQVVAQRMGGDSSWSLWVTKPADGTYQWQFARTALGPDGKLAQSAQVLAADVAETDTWVQITGVFDAQESWQWVNPSDTSQIETRYGKLHLYVGEYDQWSDDTSGFSAAQQGSGELSLGRGTTNGTTGNYLHGGLQDVRIWTGAMTADQVRSQVMGTPDNL
jgi:hypothetical protein